LTQFLTFERRRKRPRRLEIWLRTPLWTLQAVPVLGNSTSRRGGTDKIGFEWLGKVGGEGMIRLNQKGKQDSVHPGELLYRRSIIFSIPVQQWSFYPAGSSVRIL
jgi:hypothetical protein